MESNRHVLQMYLLHDVLDRHLAARRPDYFVGINMFFYFSALQVKKNDFRGPDVFVALGVERRDRKSWVVWEEASKVPDVIIELTSESTAAEDRGSKKRVYARLRVTEYFIYDPETAALEGYRIDADESTYSPIAPLSNGHLPSGPLGAELGVWDGAHLGFDGPWLRCFTAGGTPVPTTDEAERAAVRRSEEERRLREEERRLREESERKLADALAELARLRDQEKK